MNFAKEAPKLDITVGADAGMNVYDAFEQRINSECDLSHPAASQFSFLFLAIYHVFRKLRNSHPEFIVDVCILMFPRATGALGVCPLLPQGLPNPAIIKLPEGDIDSPLMDMQSSKVHKANVVE